MTQPLKIAIFQNLPSGGAKRFAFEQVRRLVLRGHRLREYALSMADLTFCDLAPFVEEQQIFEYSSSPLFARRMPFLTPYIHAAQINLDLHRLDRLSQQIVQKITADGNDIALVLDGQIMPAPYILTHLQLPTLFQCHNIRRPFAVRDGILNGTLVQRIKRRYYAPAHAHVQKIVADHEQVNIAAATKVITNSNYSQEKLLERHGIHSSVVYPGVDVRVFQPFDTGRGDYVLAVGALHPMKGYSFLIDAISCLPESRRPLLFIVANSRVASEEILIKDLAARLGVALRIETIRDDKQLVQIYNQARVFVYTPLEEPLGMAPLEANACGVPVVAVGEGGVLETVVNGETGWLVERDPIAFAEKLESLLTDAQTHERMSRRCVEYVRSEWTWERTANSLEDELFRTAASGLKTLAV